MNRFLLFFFIGFSGLVFGQPGVANTVDVAGRKYYEHKVESGNTLWGLQQMYNVPVEQILKDNPSVSDGLKDGQTVLVLVQGSVMKNEGIVSNYAVQNKETLYGLSKKFNTTVDELIRLNPELVEGLKKGQEIKVPGIIIKDEEEVVQAIVEPNSPNPFVIDSVDNNGLNQEVTIFFSDSVIEHKVLAHETMYSISKRFMVPMNELLEYNSLRSTSVKEGQILKIPLKQERVEKVDIKQVPTVKGGESNEVVSFKKKELYHIAILMPFHLEYGSGYSEYMSNLATQFYMGASIAIDSLEKLGLNAKVHIYDTKSDSLSISSILAKPEFLSMDLVIGPLLSNDVRQVAMFCKSNRIRMVCPVAHDASLLKSNPYMYSSVTSNVSLMEGLAKRMLKEKQPSHYVLIKPLDSKSLPMYEAFRKAFTESPVNGSRPNLVESTIESCGTQIKKGQITHFVLPTTDRSSAMKFMNNLNKVGFKSKGEDIYVYGTKEWLNFTDINEIYKNKYNFHYPSANFLDYYSHFSINLNKTYRLKFKTDMTKIAAQAFDVTLYFCNEFFLAKQRLNLAMNDFQMRQISEFDGYENSKVFVVGQNDFELEVIPEID